MNKIPVCLYLQERGGASFLLPVLDSLKERYTITLVAHTDCEPLLQKEGISYESLQAIFGMNDVDLIAIKSFLREKKSTFLICTLGAPYREMTNASFIQAAKELGIPSFGVFDHWKGFDRLLDEAGALSYATDFIGCIDSFCKEQLQERGVEDERLFVIGHPILERSLQMDYRSAQSLTGQKRILIVSQPCVMDRSFRGIFCMEEEGRTVLNSLLGKVKRFLPSAEVVYRPHPNEREINQLPKDLLLDTTKETVQLWERYDYFVGVNSMLLIEASLIGKVVFSFNLPVLAYENQERIPYQVGYHIEEWGQFGATLSSHSNAALLPHPSQSLKDVVMCSKERFLERIDALLKTQEFVVS